MNKLDFLKWYRKRLSRRYKELAALYKLEKRNPTVYIEDDVQIIMPHRLTLGKNIVICRGTIIECGGLEWCDYKGEVRIGDNVYIATNAILFGAGEIEIQRRCAIGVGAMITSYTPDLEGIKKDEKLLDQKVLPHKFAKVTIEEGAMIGPNSIILTGVTVGRGAVITGGCIVRHNVPPDSFVFPNIKLNQKRYLVKKE